jgi:hypothetical protein
MLLKLRRVRFELRIGEVVSGEFAIRWLSVSETTHGNAAAKRIDQAKQEQGGFAPVRCAGVAPSSERCTRETL